MKFNVAGLASAMILLTVVSAVRMGDKPTFTDPTQGEIFAKRITEETKAAAKARVPQYIAPKR